MSPSKKGPRKGSNDNLTEDQKMEKLLQRGRSYAKEEFEETRDGILQSIPDDYKSMFGQIGFTKWNKVVIPVLIMNPFHVPPGHFRETWLAMHEKVRSTVACSAVTSCRP